jgi:aspartyl-tRNA(Asn)/glutamyl-tRNA(Gln) amidotransferase subunit A
VYSFKNISSLQADLKNGSITCTQVVNELFEQIEKTKNLNAYLEVFTESAKQQALAIDAKIKSGTHGKLAGVVIALKDNIAYKGHKVSASSKILENFTSLYNATVVERLLAEDAILIGRTNCDEFAMGSSNENSAFGKVLNPVNTNTVPGGSSGGSAAVMAANLCHVALGSDTGGSIRQPASFCGVVGVKPTYGRVSRWGLLAYASSFDQIGPLTKTVEDAALVMEVIAGNDENDSTSSSKEVSKYTTQLNDSIKGTKVAYLKDCMESSGLNPEVKKRMEETIEKLKTEGVTVEGVDFPYLDYLVPAYYVLTTAEASSNLSRYDGVHYGYRSPNATDLREHLQKIKS